jgi:two-component system sensor histidine kinase UhpB
MSDLFAVELLLIEDDPDYRRLVERWLASSRELRFGVRWAARLDDAWNRIDHSDVILLDLGLPDAAGLDTLRAARDLAGDAPIVVLTGSDDADIGPRAVRAGADAFVSKRSAEPQILHAVLRRALAARARARAERWLRGRLDCST